MFQMEHTKQIKTNQILYPNAEVKSLCDYSDAFIVVKGTITIAGVGADASTQRADKRQEVTFKN